MPELLLPTQHRAASFEPTSYNAEERSIEVLWTTGATVRRVDWWDGAYDEQLITEPASVRLARLNDGAPFLNTHSTWDLGDVIGAVVPGSARIERGEGYARVRLSAAPEHESIVRNILDGIIRNISVGYRIHKVERIEEEGKPDLVRVVDWEPFELSAVPVGADPGAHVRSGNTPSRRETREFPVEIVTEGRAMNNPTSGQAASAVETITTPNLDPAVQAETRSAVAAPPVPAASPASQPVAEIVDLAGERQRATAAERARIGDITRVGDMAVRRHAGVITPEFVRGFVDNGSSADVFRAALLDRLAEHDEQGPQTNSQVRVQAGGMDETVTRVQAMKDYLVARSQNQEPPENARRYRGFRLLDCAREACRWTGIEPDGMLPMEIAGAAMTASRAYNTTSDFAQILAQTVNQNLKAAYAIAPQTYRAWAKRISLPDFNPQYTLSVSQMPGLQLVNEHGEYKRGTITSGREVMQLFTYGIVVAITRQVIVNDQLGVFSNLPGRFGNSVAQLEGDIVYGLLISNAGAGPTLATDSTAVFHAANHNNLVTAGAAPGITTISAGRVAMAHHKDLDGVTVLNISPKFILVPTSLLTVTEQLLTTISPAVSANVVPESVRQLQIVSEPRLEIGVTARPGVPGGAGVAARWYLVADPMVAESMVYAYLEGQEGPYTETRIGFDVDGVEVKCRHDFGAGIMDYRGLFQNDGA